MKWLAMDVIACFKYACFIFSKHKRTSSSPMASEIILLPDLNKLLLIWFWAMSALSKRQSFSFLFTLLLVMGVAFLATSFLVLEAFLVERLVSCKVDCRANGEAATDCLADGLAMPDR